MTDSYPTRGAVVNLPPGRPVRLTLHLGTVPQAYIPAAAAAPALGVSAEQLADWCSSGLLTATSFEGRWWVTAGDLQSFVARSSWQLVAPPG